MIKQNQVISSTASGPVRSGMTWDQMWLLRHKIGNRLPCGKAFKAYCHFERTAESHGLGRLILGSSTITIPCATGISIDLGYPSKGFIKKPHRETLLVKHGAILNPNVQ